MFPFPRDAVRACSGPGPAQEVIKFQMRGVRTCTNSRASPWPREPTAALGHRVVPPELPLSAQLGDKSSAEQSAAAPCKVQGGVSEAEAGGHLQGGHWSSWGTQPCSSKSTYCRVSEPFRLGVGTGFEKGAEATGVTPHSMGGTDFRRGCASRWWVGVRW